MSLIKRVIVGILIALYILYIIGILYAVVWVCIFMVKSLCVHILTALGWSGIYFGASFIAATIIILETYGEIEEEY